MRPVRLQTAHPAHHPNVHQIVNVPPLVPMNVCRIVREENVSNHALFRILPVIVPASHHPSVHAVSVATVTVAAVVPTLWIRVPTSIVTMETVVPRILAKLIVVEMRSAYIRIWKRRSVPMIHHPLHAETESVMPVNPKSCVLIHHTPVTQPANRE